MCLPNTVTSESRASFSLTSSSFKNGIWSTTGSPGLWCYLSSQWMKLRLNICFILIHRSKKTESKRDRGPCEVPTWWLWIQVLKQDWLSFLIVRHFPLLPVFLSLPSSGCWAVLGLLRKNVSSQGLLLWWLPVKIFIIYKMKMVVCSRCPRQAQLALSLQESQSPLIILKMSTAWKVMLVPGTKKASKKHMSNFKKH